MNVNPERFALAVVASSSSNLSLKDKFELYEKAVEFVEKQNKISHDKAIQKIKDFLNDD